MKRFVAVVILGCGVLVSQSVVRGKDEAAVWALEEDYWRYLKAGDVARYQRLWDEGFRGWPCAMMQPAGKGGVGKMVEDVRDGKLKVSYALTYEGAASYEGLVVVHYGVVEELDRMGVVTPMRVKITHTWKRFGKQWRIVGGMCGRWESY